MNFEETTSFKFWFTENEDEKLFYDTQIEGLVMSEIQSFVFISRGNIATKWKLQAAMVET